MKSDAFDMKAKMKTLTLLFLVGLIMVFTVSTFLSTLDYTPNVEDQITHLIRSSPEWPQMNSNFKNIFWIVQISDIHISVHDDHERGPDLSRFCREYLSIIDPELVIITGDLVHTKHAVQNVKEWEIYHDVVHKCQKMSRGKWLDIRGNHDTIDVPNFESERNYYKHFSVFGNAMTETHQESYHYKLNLAFGNYTFIGFDAALQPGPKRPFNYFGYLNDKQIQRIKRLSEESRSSNHTVWFGHFPSSLIVHDPIVLRSLMRDSIAYLCGHLHTLFNHVPRLYTRQKTGQLELELGDWKDNRIFRVMVFDHDLMSFVDAKLRDWPLVIITNPKDSQFYSTNEPIKKVQQSTHVRVLVFNPEPIESVHVKIDGLDIGVAEHAQGPLFVKAWNPLDYDDGLHQIEIVVRDKAERKKSVVQHFSFQVLSPRFEFIPRLLLMTNIFSLGKIVFGVLVFSYIIILELLRRCTNIRRFFICGVPLIGSLFNSVLVKVWLVSQATPIYSICVGCILYLTFGPWFYGDMLSGETGVVFLWGIVYSSAFIPSGTTYYYGIFQVLTFNLPLLLLLGHILDLKWRLGHNFKFMELSFSSITSLLLFVFWVYITMYEFPKAYGLKALFFGPLRLGCVFIIPVAIRMSLQYDVKHTVAVVRIN